MQTEIHTEPVRKAYLPKTEKVEATGSQVDVEQVEPEKVKVNTDKSTLLRNFLLFVVIVCGYVVKPCHHKWSAFMLVRKLSLILAPRDHGKCVRGQTQLMMPDGQMKQVKDLVGAQFSVLTMNTKYKLTKSKAVKVISNGVKRVYEVVTRSGRHIGLTDNHPMYTINGWKTLAELKVGDRVATPRTYEYLKYAETSMPAGVAKWLGYMVGDGCCQNASLSCGDDDTLQDFTEACNLIGFTVNKGSKYTYYVSNNYNPNHNPHKLLRQYNLHEKGSFTKFVPSSIFSAPRVQIAEFIAGYFMADGHVHTDPTVGTLEISSQSKQLIQQCQHLLLRLGIMSRVKRKDYQYNGKPAVSWLLSIYSKEHITKFHQTIPLVSYKKANLEILVSRLSERKVNPVTDIVPIDWLKKLKNTTKGKLERFNVNTYSSKYGTSRTKVSKAGNIDNNDDLTNLGVSDLLWDEIESVEYVGEEETFDLSVPETENFVADDIIIHNSLILTVSYILWRIIKNPNIRILIVSNGATTAQRMLKGIKEHFEKNPILRSIFGDYVGKDDWSTTSITVSKRTGIGLREPTVSTVGVYGTIVSGHFDLIICDDLCDFENTRIKAQRDKLWNWLWMVLMPTLETDEIDPTKDGDIGFIGTRYHHDDLYGRLIGDEVNPGPCWEHYLADAALMVDGRPATDDEINNLVSHDALEALWGERKSVERLLQTRRNSGSIIFGLQYQNNAEMTKGRIFKLEHFQNYYTDLPEDLILFCGTDLSVKDGEENDFFALIVIGVDQKTKNVYLIDGYRVRRTAPKQYELIKKSYSSWNWTAGGVESVAFQEAMVQWLQENTAVPVKGVPRRTDKILRAYKIQHFFENGKFFMPYGSAKKYAELVDEMVLFPDGDHDDFFDALETALSVAFDNNFNFLFV